MKNFIFTTLVLLFAIRILGQTCSGTVVLTAPSGSISDGSGSSYYSNNLDCGWLIQPPNANVIKLCINSTSLGFQGGDTVAVYDGTDETGILLTKIWLSLLGCDSLTALSGSMFIHFTTNAHDTAHGWDGAYVSTSATGIKENDYSGFYIFPNPANNKLIVEMQNVSSTQKNFSSIYNIQGQLLLQNELQQIKSEVNISCLEKGLYFIKIESAENTIIKKFIKK